MKKTLLLIFCLCCFRAGAQEFVGLSNSNYSGIHAAYRNPATLAASPISFQLNLSAIGVHGFNNYLQFDPPFSTLELIKEGMEVEDSYFVEKLNGKSKYFSLGAEYRGPALLISTRKLGFAVSTRSRLFVQGNDISEQTARLLWLGADNAAVQGKPLMNQQAKLNVNLVNEAAFSFSAVMLEAGPHELKGGVTLKRLWGLYSGNVNFDNFSYEIVEDANAENYLDIEHIDVDFAYTTTDRYQEDIAWQDILLMKEAAGRGWGWDLGMEYIFRPRKAVDEEETTAAEDEVETINRDSRREIPPYRFRLGFALTDLGHIRYSGNQAMRHYRFSRDKQVVSSENLEESDPAALDEVLVETFNIRPSERLNSYETYLPASLGINLDTRLLGALFVNVAWLGNVYGTRKAGLQQNSLWSLTPRLEGRVFELAVPFSYYSELKHFSFGPYFRLGPFFMGSDNLSGLLGMGEAYGADFYLGFSIYSVKKSYKNKNRKHKKED